MRTTIVGATILVVGASASTVWAVNGPDTTGNNIALQGSDTLEEVTKAVLLDSRCIAAASPQSITYAGGGSSTGETAMSLATPTQKVAPMSRFFNQSTGVCAHQATADGLVIGLDGLAIVGATGTAGTCSGGVAFSGSFTVTDSTGAPVVNCPGCDTGTSTYTIGGPTGGSGNVAGWKDVLKLVYTGIGHDGTRDCAGNVRKSLVAQWAKLFQGSCTSGTCSQLTHAFRRGDTSGTTDVLLAALGAPLKGLASQQIAATKPAINWFCNAVPLNTLNPAPYPDSSCTGAGTPRAECTANGLNGGTGTANTGLSFGGASDYLDGDPIRRTCDPKEQVCQKGSDPTAAVGTPGDLGLVLPVEVPTNLSAAQLYPTQSCSTGKFAIALPKPSGDPAALPNPPCPNGGGLIFGGCFQPFFQANAADTQHFNCLYKFNTPPFPVQGFATNGMTDGRAYNLFVKDDATGNYLRDGLQVPQAPATFAAGVIAGNSPNQIQRLTVGAYFRKHLLSGIATGSSACVLNDSTAQIGCLTQADSCGLGYAGREADQAVAGGVITALNVNGIADTAANIAQLLNPSPVNLYPLSRKLFFNTLVGFGNLVPSGASTSGEFELAKCFGNSAIVNPIMASHGFIPMNDATVTPFNPGGKAICQNMPNATCSPGTSGDNGVCATAAGLPAGLIQ